MGDSRGVLCDKDGNAVALSHDHKPYQLKERKRIKRAGETEYAAQAKLIILSNYDLYTFCTKCICFWFISKLAQEIKP